MMTVTAGDGNPSIKSRDDIGPASTDSDDQQLSVYDTNIPGIDTHGDGLELSTFLPFIIVAPDPERAMPDNNSSIILEPLPGTRVPSPAIVFIPEPSTGLGSRTSILAEG